MGVSIKRIRNFENFNLFFKCNFFHGGKKTRRRVNFIRQTDSYKLFQQILLYSCIVLQQTLRMSWGYLISFLVYELAKACFPFEIDFSKRIQFRNYDFFSCFLFQKKTKNVLKNSNAIESAECKLLKDSCPWIGEKKFVSTKFSSADFIPRLIE